MTRRLEETIEILLLHRENLEACDTFERFKLVQVAFITLLIDERKAELARERAVKEYLDRTECVTGWRVEMKVPVADEQGPCPICGVVDRVRVGPCHVLGCGRADTAP